MSVLIKEQWIAQGNRITLDEGGQYIPNKKHDLLLVVEFGGHRCFGGNWS